MLCHHCWLELCTLVGIMVNPCHPKGHVKILPSHLLLPFPLPLWAESSSYFPCPQQLFSDRGYSIPKSRIPSSTAQQLPLPQRDYHPQTHNPKTSPEISQSLQPHLPEIKTQSSAMSLSAYPWQFNYKFPFIGKRQFQGC